MLLRQDLGKFDRQGGPGLAILGTCERQVSPGPAVLGTSEYQVGLIPLIWASLNINLALERHPVGSGPAEAGF